MDGGSTRAGSARNGPVLRQLHVPQEGNLHRNQRQSGPRRLLAEALLSLFALAGCNANPPPTTPTAIKIAFLSHCLSDSGPFYNHHLGRAPPFSPPHSA